MRDKSIYFRLPKTGKKGFLLEHDYMPYFYDKLHYHPELQLKFVIEGTGDLFVGNTFTHFEPGNLFLIGPNQSHVFKSDPDYFEEDSKLISHSISVFFQEESLGNDFFTIEEMSDIKNLIERSGRGIQFSPAAVKQVESRIKGLVDISGFDQFLEILSILNELATTDGYKYLATVNSPEPLSDNENHKINEVINYIFSNFKKNIKLEDAAKIANYSQAAFCHFFKQHTRKTFIQFLIEVRVSKACQMLQKNQLNVSQICYECGFNNVSNFNRQFKKVTGLSPTAYVKKYEERVESIAHINL